MVRRLFRKTIKSIFIFLNILIAVLFILTYCIPYLNPHHWWWAGFAGLAIPHAVIALLLLGCFWLIVKPKWALVSAIALLIGCRQISAVFAFHFQSNFIETKDSTNIRLVNWNIAGFSGISKNKEKRVHARTEIADLIKRYKPDIICLQEFNNSIAPDDKNSNLKLFSQDYPYYFFSNESDSGIFYQCGSIIFSKFPIIFSKRVRLPGNYPESILYADILVNNDTIRIYTTHLQSFMFAGSENIAVQKIRARDDEMWDASKSVARKMKIAFSRRGKQTDVVRHELDKSPYPSIISGDFNDVPCSYTYRQIRNKRQDAFLKKDYGVGRTYLALSPTLRIDYILPDNNFTVHQFVMVDESLSDHLMLVSDVSLKK